jgi:hypothetical protein
VIISQKFHFSTMVHDPILERVPVVKHKQGQPPTRTRCAEVQLCWTRMDTCSGILDRYRRALVRPMIHHLISSCSYPWIFLLLPLFIIKVCRQWSFHRQSFPLLWNAIHYDIHFCSRRQTGCSSHCKKYAKLGTRMAWPYPSQDTLPPPTASISETQ